MWACISSIIKNWALGRKTSSMSILQPEKESSLSHSYSGCQWHYFFSRQTFYGSFTPIAGGKQGYRNQFRKGLIDRLNFTEKKGIFTAFITSIFYYDFSSVYRAYLALFPSFSFKLWGLSLLWFWFRARATFLSSYKHGSNLTWIGYRDEKTGTLKRVT